MSKHVPGAGKLLLAAALRGLLLAAEAVVAESNLGVDEANPDEWYWAEITRKAIDDLASAVGAVKKGLQQEGF